MEDDEEEYPQGSTHIQAVKEFHAKIRELRKKDCMAFYSPKLTCRQRHEIWSNRKATLKSMAAKYSIHPVNVSLIRRSPEPLICEKHQEN